MDRAACDEEGVTLLQRPIRPAAGLKYQSALEYVADFIAGVRVIPDDRIRQQGRRANDDFLSRDPRLIVVLQQGPDCGLRLRKANRCVQRCDCQRHQRGLGHRLMMKAIGSLVCVIVLAVLMLYASTNQLARADRQSIDSNDPRVSEGRALRREVEAAYAQLQAAHLPGLDVTATLMRHIPVGTTFDDAEAILRSAGCKLSGRPPARHAGEAVPNEDAVIARATLGGGGFQAIMFFASLTPKYPGEFSTVQSVAGGLLVESP